MTINPGFRLFLTISIVLLLVFTPLTHLEVHASTSRPTALALVTLQGKVRFEGGTDHQAIIAQLKNTTLNQIVGTASTDSAGNYSFANVDDSYDYTINAAATYIGYASASSSLSTAQLKASGGVYVVPDLLLLHPHQFALDWVYQPDGATSFNTGSPTSGSIILTSESKFWRNGVRVASKVNFKFCFSSSSTADCSDFYVTNSSQFPSGVWANSSGLGGILDMGEVTLESVIQAPDKTTGYNPQLYPSIIGHTYAVLTNDGNHYAKIHINAIQDVIYSWYFLPLIQK